LRHARRIDRIQLHRDVETIQVGVNAATAGLSPVRRAF